MKQYKTSTLGRDLYLFGPENVEEYEAKGGPGSVVQHAVEGLIAWDTLPDFHANLTKRLIAAFNISRGIDEKATEKARSRAKTPEAAKAVKDVPEKYTAYIKRVEATTSTDPDTKAAFDAAWKAAESETEIDPSPAKRGSRGPGKEYVDRAAQFLALPTDQLEAKITKIGLVVDNVESILVRDADGVPSEESLAYAIKAWAAAAL